MNETTSSVAMPRRKEMPVAAALRVLAAERGEAIVVTTMGATREWPGLSQHPLDFHYAANPPANPRLLTLLADELSSGRFQLRPFIRELALTRAYQRSCEATRPDTVNFADIVARQAQLLLEKAAQQKSLDPLKDALAESKAKFKTARDADSRVAAELPPHAARHELGRVRPQSDVRGGGAAPQS